MGKAPETSGNPVFRNDPPKFASKYIYFYYLKHSEPTIECYFIKRRDRVSWDDMESEVRRIVEEIRDGDERPDGTDPRYQKWKHRSYFVVVLDDREHSLDEANPITVNYAGGEHYGTFMNGRSLPYVDTNISGFYCLNHLKRADGPVLQEDEEERFSMEVNHSPRSEGLRNHEISGTNMGPPIGGG